MIEIKNQKSISTILFRAEGIISLEEIQKLSETGKAVIDSYRGEKHLVFADMRGLKPMAPKAAEALGTFIGYGRANGTEYCVHLSDDTVQRLQAARLARRVSPQDANTVDVVSLEEAQKVLTELRLKLRMNASNRAAG